MVLSKTFCFNCHEVEFTLFIHFMALKRKTPYKRASAVRGFSASGVELRRKMANQFAGEFFAAKKHILGL
jgi:hypothetical protein